MPRSFTADGSHSVRALSRERGLQDFSQEEKENILPDKRSQRSIRSGRLSKEPSYKRVREMLPLLDVKPNRKEVILHKMLIDIAIPYVTARCWAIYDARNEEFLFGRLERERREIASLTKIMVFYTALQLCEQLGFDHHKTLVTVSPGSQNINGTVANLREGDVLSLHDLFYALMLPSGNDAGYLLAEWFGNFLRDNSISRDSQPLLLHRYSLFGMTPARYFLMEMNYFASKLGLTNSYFDSPHGLANKYNTSTAQDVARLVSECMRNDKFREVVGTKRYACRSKCGSEKPSRYAWDNTNRLLDKGFNGVKTGITPTAGPCLAASIFKDEEQLVVIVLNSKSMDHRWIEVPKLANWALNRLKKVREFPFPKETPNAGSRILNRLRHL